MKRLVYAVAALLATVSVSAPAWGQTACGEQSLTEGRTKDATQHYFLCVSKTRVWREIEVFSYKTAISSWTVKALLGHATMGTRQLVSYGMSEHEADRFTTTAIAHGWFRGKPGDLPRPWSARACRYFRELERAYWPRNPITASGCSADGGLAAEKAPAAQADSGTAGERTSRPP